MLSKDAPTGTTPKRSGSVLAVSIAIAVLLTAGALLFFAYQSGDRAQRALKAPDKNDLSFDQVRLEQEAREQADQRAAWLVDDRSRDLEGIRDSKAVAPKVKGDPLAIGKIGTLDLEQHADRDLVGVDRYQQRILGDDDFRRAISAWPAPRRCAEERKAAGGKTFTIGLTIGPDGKVLEAQPREVDSPSERAIALCIVRDTASLSFPATGGDVPYEREAKFVF